MTHLKQAMIPTPIEDTERNHPGCWILVHDLRRDRSRRITGGRVAAAAANRDDFNGQVESVIDAIVGELLIRHVPGLDDEFRESDDL